MSYELEFNLRAWKVVRSVSFELSDKKRKARKGVYYNQFELVLDIFHYLNLMGEKGGTCFQGTILL